MMLLWASAGVPLGVYNISQEFNIALRIQPQILTLLSLITWSQCYHYSKGWSWEKCAVCLAIIGLLMGGVEVGLVFALKHGSSRGIEWPITLMAVLAAVLLAAGVGRHYWDIYKHRTVRGISFIFVAIDAAGDLFSLISIFFQAETSILGMVIYGTELALWIGIFACGGYFNFAPWIQARISKRRADMEQSEVRTPEQERGGIAMHDMPSSTSVFRTPSGVLVERHGTTGRQ